MRAWRIALLAAWGQPRFRELEDATRGLDRRTVRAGTRAARRGTTAPDVASARVAVARARANRAEARDPDRPDDDAAGRRLAQGGIAVVWLGLAAVDGLTLQGVWQLAMGVLFVIVAAPNPARRQARARKAEAVNRGVLRDHGVPYVSGDGPAYVPVPLGHGLAALAAVAVLSATALACVLGAFDGAFPPDGTDIAIAAGVCAVYSVVPFVAGRRRAAVRAVPPRPVEPERP